MSKVKFLILAKAYDRKGNLLSTASNNYKKSHPIQKMFAEKANCPEKIYLHAELLCLLRAGDNKVFTLTVERYSKDGKMQLAKPCCVCQEAIKSYGVKEVQYTSPEGWVKESYAATE